VALADEALYAAKNQGRDRYVASEPGALRDPASTLVDPAAATLPLREASGS